jgi:hypothetical protein
VRAELERTETDLRAARSRMETAIDALAALEPQRVELEQERERMRAEGRRRRARRCRPRNSARAIWRCKWNRGAPRTRPDLDAGRAWRSSWKELEAQRRDELAAQLKEGEAPLAALADSVGTSAAVARTNRG